MMNMSVKSFCLRPLPATKATIYRKYNLHVEKKEYVHWTINSLKKDRLR